MMPSRFALSLLITRRLAASLQGMIDCAKQIISKEGPTGLYKGMAAPLAGELSNDGLYQHLRLVVADFAPMQSLSLVELDHEQT